MFANLLQRLKKLRRSHDDQKRQKLLERDKERQEDTLLRIALKRPTSMNSFTAADPGTHYRRRGEEAEVWDVHEAGGTRLGRKGT